MLRYLLLLLFSPSVFSQKLYMDRFVMQEDVTITIDQPGYYKSDRPTIVILYALPNGNTTDQTIGKKMQPGDDWHFDIQHIRAQTKFIASKIKNRNITIVYLENNYKSWPAWKAKHTDYKERIRGIIDTIFAKTLTTSREIYLNGHSGGGRFIFSVMDAFDEIPSYIKRISFLDSNYGYDSVYYPKLLKWLQQSRSNYLNVFAYNDSVALYEGKPVVSATGGTWYRSHWMLRYFSNNYKFHTTANDSIITYKSRNDQVQFFLKTNPDRKIYHTQQVERNGFIHSVLCGTRYDGRGYRYFGKRAYGELIE